MTNKTYRMPKRLGAPGFIAATHEDVHMIKLLGGMTVDGVIELKESSFENEPAFPA